MTLVPLMRSSFVTRSSMPTQTEKSFPKSCRPIITNGFQNQCVGESSHGAIRHAPPGKDLKNRRDPTKISKAPTKAGRKIQIKSIRSIHSFCQGKPGSESMLPRHIGIEVDATRTGQGLGCTIPWPSPHRYTAQPASLHGPAASVTLSRLIW